MIATQTSVSTFLGSNRSSAFRRHPISSHPYSSTRDSFILLKFQFCFLCLLSMVQKASSTSKYSLRERETLSAGDDKPRQWFRDLIVQYICFALFSTVFVPPVSATETFLRVSELEFSEKLSNPCDLVDASQLQGVTLTQENKNASRQTVINEMKSKISLLKENAETILQTNVLKDCSALQLPSIAIIPSAEDVTDSTPLSALRLFYTSLLNHTAYVYFISDQMQRHSEEGNCNSPHLSENARSLASGMRELMCASRVSMLMFQNGENDTLGDSTEQILNETFTDQPLCSRRSVRDCQTIDSTVTLLRKLSNYLETAVSVVPCDFTTKVYLSLL